VTPEHEILEEHGEDREQHAQEECQEEEDDHVRGVEEPEGVGDRHHDIPRELDDGAQELEGHDGRHGQDPDDPVARVAEHDAVAEDGVEEPPLPAVPLPPEHGQALRHLRPADRVRHEAEPGIGDLG
jgi:hypothetical protein